MFRDARSRYAAIAIFVGQMVSASYFYSPSSVYLYMSKDLGQNISGLGLLSTAFLIGIGGFQIPVGLLAEKIGSRRTVIYGTFLAAVSTLLTGVPSQIDALAVLRFLTGVGMAFLFAPSITLVAKYFQKEYIGFGIGLVAGTFDLGGIAVIPGWAVLGRIEGWRVSFAIAGILGLATAFAIMALVPKEEVRSSFRFSLGDLRRLLLDKWLLAVGFAALSAQVGWTIVGSFMVYYLENNFNIIPAIAGVVGSLFLAAALLSSPLAGRIYGRVGRPLRMLVGGSLLSAAGLGVAAVVSPYAATVSTAIVGAADGVGFTTAYILARDIRDASSELMHYETLPVSWVNGISLVGSFWAPVLFSYSAIGLGYSQAWLVIGLASIPLVVPVLLMNRRGTVRAQSRTMSIAREELTPSAVND